MNWLELMNNMGLIVSRCGYGAEKHSWVSPPHPAGFCLSQSAQADFSEFSRDLWIDHIDLSISWRLTGSGYRFESRCLLSVHYDLNEQVSLSGCQVSATVTVLLTYCTCQICLKQFMQWKGEPCVSQTLHGEIRSAQWFISDSSKNMKYASLSSQYDVKFILIWITVISVTEMVLAFYWP